MTWIPVEREWKNHPDSTPALISRDRAALRNRSKRYLRICQRTRIIERGRVEMWYALWFLASDGSSHNTAFHLDLP
jgi:hypothetical protein